MLVHHTIGCCSERARPARLLDALRSPAGIRNDEIAPCRLSRPGGARVGKGRSDVGCSHAEGCPLFPLLRASLRGWRDYYCDSNTRWRECARYKLALTGQVVPISLLPNGHDALHLQRARDAEEYGAAAPGPVHRPVPPRPYPGSPETTARFEPAPPSAPVPPFEPEPPTPAPQAPASPPTRSTRHARPAHATRHWWSRLVDWMRNPA